MYDIFISYNTKDQAIAEEVYKRLNEEGFRCFLATEDLNGIDWAGDIVAALEDARGFVIIISRNSVASNEVLKEVTLATRYSQYIFPFMLENVKMERKMEYHLAPFQWISAVIPPMEMRLQDLVSRVKDALQGGMTDGNVNYDRIELVGQNLSPRAEFTGREAELEQLWDILSEGNNTVFLTGMGGIGKSEIARAFAKNHRDDYKTIVMSSYQTSLLDLIADDRAIVIKGCSRGAVSAGQCESIEDYYGRKLEALRQAVGKDTLLIIDNFDVEEDENLADILDLPCDKIITSRVNYEELGYPTVFVEAMDAKTVLLPLMERMDHKYLKPEDQEMALRIIQLLDCHTYAVSLTASQMKAGHIQPRKMYELLSNEGLKYQTRSTFSRNAGEKKTAVDYIRMLYDFTKLSEAERRILCCMACSPIEGIDTDLFMELAEVEDFEDIHKLIALNWIQEDSEANLLRIHMLVRELTKEQEEFSLAYCMPYVRMLRLKVGNSCGWDNSYEYNLSLESAVLAVLRVFPKPDIAYRGEFETFASFAWVMNQFDISEKMEMWLYDSCVKEYGQYSEVTGFQATRVAAVFHNHKEIDKARPWYQKAKEIMIQSSEDNSTKVTSYFKVARSDQMLGDIEQAEKGYLEALEVCDRIIAADIQDKQTLDSDKTEAQRAKLQACMIKSALAVIYGSRGELDRGIEILKEQIDTIPQLSATSSIMYVRMALANLYMEKGEVDKAKEMYEELLVFCRDLHGDNMDTIMLYELLGNTMIKSGKPLEAAAYYADALNKQERYFPGDTAGIRHLEEKYEKARNGQVFEIPYQFVAL